VLRAVAHGRWVAAVLAALAALAPGCSGESAKDLSDRGAQSRLPAGVGRAPSAGEPQFTSVVLVGNDGRSVELRPPQAVLAGFPGSRGRARAQGGYLRLYVLGPDGLPGISGRYYPATHAVCLSWSPAERERACPRADSAAARLLTAGTELAPFTREPTTLRLLSHANGEVDDRFANLNVAVELAFDRERLAHPTARPPGCLAFTADWQGPAAATRPTDICLASSGAWANGRLYPLGRGVSAFAEETVVRAAPSGRLVAYVSAESENRLVAVDVRSRRVLRRIRVASGPHNVAATPDGRFVLVTSPPAGRVTLVAGRSLRVLKVFRGLRYPHDVEVAAGGRYAYVTEERGAAIAVLDLAQRRVVRRFRVAPGPHDLAVSPNGRQIWITHGPGQRSITLARSRPARRAMAIGRFGAGGGSPHDIFFAPNGRRVWVTYWDSARVGAYARSRRLVVGARAGIVPHHVAVGPLSNFVWITDHATGRAAILLERTGRRLRTVAVGPSPHHVAMLGRYAVVASHDGGTLSVHRPGGRRLSTIRVGHGLHGVALARIP
jgi:hypothetical protein